MAEKVTLEIDGIEVMAPAGATIFEAARLGGVEIPHLCYDAAWEFPPTSSCRLCLVEVEGAKGPVP